MEKKINFVEELRWRGMIQDIMPGAEEQLGKGMTTAYVGIDPTADSLHIGHLVSVMMLKHLQRCGHRPIVLLGGATGMIGDPSGKSLERNMLDEKSLKQNQEAIKRQLSGLIDFNSDQPNAAVMTNNYDWMKELSFLEFIRDIGKLITVNYMMSKESVKRRFDADGAGMSFTEFSYQLVQGYDFLHLYQELGCKMQLGGSDQWGNITTGVEIIRRKLGEEAFGITCPLIRKADGNKFGKTESGNIWLDARYTSPYKFYQFWLNVSDEDADTYIKIFTMLDKGEIDQLIGQHQSAPHERVLQKRLAKEVTTMIHSEDGYQRALEASTILFGDATAEVLRELEESELLEVFDGVPQYRVARAEIVKGVNIVDLCGDKTEIFSSKGETRKLIQGGGVSLNKGRVEGVDYVVDQSDLISDKYLIVQRGRRNYYLIVVE